MHREGNHHRKTLAAGAIGLALMLPALIALAQSSNQSASNTAPAPALSVDVKVVTMPVTVRDKKGQIVRNLTKDDFSLQENGRPQTIRYFSQEKDLPFTVGLLVDTSLSERNVLDEEKTASKSFIDQMLTRPKDQGFLLHFDRQVELLQDVTSSRDKMESALQLLQLPQRSNDTSSGDDPDHSGGSRHAHGGTALYDSVFLAADEVIKKQPGRKALIVLSDGDDRGSKETLNHAIEAAQRADTVVYAIYFADKNREREHEFGGPGGGRRRGGGWPGGGGGGWPGGGGGWPGSGGGGGRRGGGGQRTPEESHVDGKKVLDQIARETGGRLNEVSKKQSVDQIYSNIAEELRTQYMLGYTPEKSDVSSGYRRITLTAKKNDLTVQTRDGYYAN